MLVTSSACNTASHSDGRDKSRKIRTKFDGYDLVLVWASNCVPQQQQ